MSDITKQYYLPGTPPAHRSDASAVPSYEIEMVNPPGQRDLPEGSPHVSFHTVLEAMSYAWKSAVRDTCGHLLEPTDFGIVHVESDHPAEVFVGDSSHDVTLVKVGRTSLTFHIVLSQEGREAAIATMVVVKVNEARDSAEPLTDEERQAFEQLQRTSN